MAPLTVRNGLSCLQRCAEFPVQWAQGPWLCHVRSTCSTLHSVLRAILQASQEAGGAQPDDSSSGMDPGSSDDDDEDGSWGSSRRSTDDASVASRRSTM